ncbi:hypothetical protein MRB53_037687 [Persea americana]|nr:hypothetical protein MRB53_037687 [Persea americana]
MFEKDVLQLIRGLRAHKGQEREFIQSALRECRKEIKSQDMDLKAIALLKLVYLEMFGHDMSWASFNVLEVMSSQKFVQKRVGYLAAVQSFRPDTEVLMLAENLLKKDLGNTDKNTISLALSTLPHLINTSMANSLLTDLLPRLSHSNPTIRKKTIVTLYRLALVYPEVLRPSWPKIKERLLDENEDPSVTAAIVNVVCELGWRRPHDFLPMAPRFFDLLTEGQNNWMSIKIIKLFSVLTPLEPRLVKKLLPLTQLIKTTPAMSLLYECINGIIQGGIMEAAAGTTEGDEVARLCISKLRGMLVVQNDPNLRYVALLAFAKITTSHASLVTEHQDVILECVDDLDISIRTRALDLAIGMINENNLQIVVDRLLRQLRTSGTVSAVDDPDNDRSAHDGVVPIAEDDEEDAQASIRRTNQSKDQTPPLPDHYRALVIERIVEMCSEDMYARLVDFEWYIDVLVNLIKQCPAEPSNTGVSISERVGAELLNVAVRVKAIRPEAAAAAQSLLFLEDKDSYTGSDRSSGALTAISFIAGEFASLLPDPEAVLTSLLHPNNSHLASKILASYAQAVPKVFVALTSQERISWTTGRRSQVTLLIARIVHWLEPLTLHPSLQVQERAVEFLELFRLADEACKGHETVEDSSPFMEPPLLLTQAIPALFSSMELNPIAPSAIHQARPAAELLESHTQQSYQSSSLSDKVDVEARQRKRAERRERNKDDPYYIDPDGRSGTSTPMGNALHSAVGDEELNVDDIPVMELKLDNGHAVSKPAKQAAAPKKPKRHFEIAGDETLSTRDASSTSLPSLVPSRQNQAKKGLMGIDSSGLSALSLESGGNRTTLDIEARAREEEEMARAIREVERLRLAMQRRTEEVQDTGEGESIVVKRKKKKVRSALLEDNTEAGGNVDNGDVVEKKKKKKKKKPEGEATAVAQTNEAEQAEQPKAKKKEKASDCFR